MHHPKGQTIIGQLSKKLQMTNDLRKVAAGQGSFLKKLIRSSLCLKKKVRNIQNPDFPNNPNMRRTEEILVWDACENAD